MKNFVKATLASVFLAAIGTAQAASIEANCISNEKNTMPGMRVPFTADQKATTTRFTLSMGEFDDLFTSKGSPIVRFLTEEDKNGQREIKIGDIAAKLHEDFSDESVTLELTNDNFDVLFAADSNEGIAKNGWSCSLQRPAP